MCGGQTVGMSSRCHLGRWHTPGESANGEVSTRADGVPARGSGTARPPRGDRQGRRTTRATAPRGVRERTRVADSRPGRAELAAQVGGVHVDAALLDLQGAHGVLADPAAQRLEAVREHLEHLEGGGEGGGDQVLGGQVGDLGVEQPGVQPGAEEGHAAGADHRAVRLVQVAPDGSHGQPGRRPVRGGPRDREPVLRQQQRRVHARLRSGPGPQGDLDGLAARRHPLRLDVLGHQRVRQRGAELDAGHPGPVEQPGDQVPGGGEVLHLPEASAAVPPGGVAEGGGAGGEQLGGNASRRRRSGPGPAPPGWPRPRPPSPGPARRRPRPGRPPRTRARRCRCRSRGRPPGGRRRRPDGRRGARPPPAGSPAPGRRG